MLRYLHERGIGIGVDVLLAVVQAEASMVQVTVAGRDVELTGRAASAVRVDVV